MRSMTGFSESTLLKDDIEFKCISKSLNSRFLEINVKLPMNLKGHEGWVRDYINKNFARGKATDPTLDPTSIRFIFLFLSNTF